MVKCKLAHVGEVGFACPPLEDVLGGPNTCTCQGLLRLVGRAADNLARIMRIPLTGNIDVFSLRGPPAYYTPIGLGPLGGHPAYKPLTREGTHQITQRGRPPGVLILMGLPPRSP